MKITEAKRLMEENKWHAESLYNIGAVSRMTGIPEATLRVWERRYGFPDPARTDGRHRLYSQAEIDRLIWVKNRVDSGLQVSKAVRMLHNLQAAELESASNPPSTEIVITPQRPHEDKALWAFRKRLLEALVSHDVNKADQVLAEVLAMYSLEVLALDVIGLTLHDIGEAWALGGISVATEHFATGHLRHHLLMWQRSSPPPYPTPPIVLACAPGEWHEGSLLIVGLLLRRLRWPCLYLGPSVPLPDLAVFVQDMQPAALVFVAMGQESAEALAEWPNWLMNNPRAKKGAIVAYGGRAFITDPDLISRTPGQYLGDTLREGVETLDLLLREAIPNPAEGIRSE